jgi:hypothetical protein
MYAVVAAVAGPRSQVAGGRPDVLRRAGAFWYVGLSWCVIGLTALARAVSPLMFRRFIGEANPIAVAMGVSALGALLLSVLVVRDGFSIAGLDVGRGVARSAGLAVFFGAVIIVADFAIVHPADMNVPFPRSLVFYPVIGFMVEVLFHVFPHLGARPCRARCNRSELMVVPHVGNHQDGTRGTVLLGFGLAAGILGIIGAVGWSRFAAALNIHRARINRGSQVMSSRFGQIEFATVGHGAPVLIVHGAGGGFDQGIAAAGRLNALGYQVSRLPLIGSKRRRWSSPWRTTSTERSRPRASSRPPFPARAC